MKNYLEYLYQPMLNMGKPSHKQPLFLKAINFEYQDLIHGEINLSTQRLLPQSFRDVLVKEVGKGGYHLSQLNPNNLAGEMRTERWEYMLSKYNQYKDLDAQEQALLNRLLIRLGLHSKVLEIEPGIREEAIKDNYFATLIYLQRGYCSYSNVLDFGHSFEPAWEIVRQYSSNSILKMGAILCLIVYHSNITRDIGTISNLVSEAQDILKTLDKILDDELLYSYYVSRFYRTTSYLPFLQGNQALMVKELELSEDFATKAFSLAKSERNLTIMQENLLTVFETRSKEKMATKELDLAESYILKKVDFDPLDSKSFLELGDILYKKKDYEGAVNAYLKCKTLGVPCTAVANCKIGWIYEKHFGRKTEAMSYYFDCLNADPLSLTAIRQIYNQLPDSGEPLSDWASYYLNMLEDQLELKK